MIAEVAAQRCVQPVVVISFKRTPARIQFTGHDDLPNSLPLEISDQNPFQSTNCTMNAR